MIFFAAIDRIKIIPTSYRLVDVLYPSGLGGINEEFTMEQICLENLSTRILEIGSRDKRFSITRAECAIDEEKVLISPEGYSVFGSGFFAPPKDFYLVGGRKPCNGLDARVDKIVKAYIRNIQRLKK